MTLKAVKSINEEVERKRKAPETAHELGDNKVELDLESLLHHRAAKPRKPIC